MILRVFVWTIFFTGLVINIHRKGGGVKIDFSFESLFFLFTSLLAVISISLLLELLENKKKQKWIAAFVAFCFGIAFYYSKRTSFPFSYSLLINNFGIFFSWTGIRLFGKLIYSTFFASDFFWSSVFCALVFKSYSWKKSKKFNPRAKVLVAGLAIVTILSVSLIQSFSFDPMTHFIRSAYHHYAPTNNVLTEIAEKKENLPSISVKTQFMNEEKPHIFLLIVESLNDRFINQKNEDGIELTPYINQLTKSALYFPNYNSNSVQTAKGHFAALCGQIPMTRAIEFKNDECFSKKCLPSILAENGYSTTFIQADPNLNYDNNQKFMLSHGFQKMPALAKPCELESHPCYGLGIRDDIFYQRFFNYLSSIPESQGPQFMVLATIANHMPFNFMPENERRIYPNPKNLKENYLNSLRMVDDSMRVFIKLFNESPKSKNSILIITGDHGFPTGEHGSNHNENFAFFENFDVPLIIIDSRRDLKNIFSPLEKRSFSHLNLAPTILDLAGISTETDFIAQSIFSSINDPVYLVQPYSGGYQSVVSWPYSYTFEEHKQRESIYNLENDPDQKRPLKLVDYPIILPFLRTLAAQIHKQQSVFECKK